MRLNIDKEAARLTVEFCCCCCCCCCCCFTLFLSIYRLDAQNSYFRVSPPRVDDEAILYETTCSCISPNENKIKECEPPNRMLKALNTNMKPMPNIRRLKKRDVSQSDALTDEDYEYFKEPGAFQRPSRVHLRTKRAAEVFPVSRENATRYCTEKLVESYIGKFCAKVGTDVHSFVNACSVDIMVKFNVKHI